MKNTSISLFRQILDLVPKHEFEKIIMKHNGDKHKQTFDCWFARKHVFRFYYDPSFPADQVHQVCPFQDQWFIGICGAMLFKVSFQFIKAQAAGGDERLFVLFLQIWAVVCEFFHVVT